MRGQSRTTSYVTTCDEADGGIALLPRTDSFRDEVSGEAYVLRRMRRMRPHTVPLEVGEEEEEEEEAEAVVVVIAAVAAATEAAELEATGSDDLS